MATVIGLTNEQRDEIWESMTAEQIKVLKNFDRFLWKSYNLTVQYNNSAKWDFIGIEIDHFYKRGTRHQKNYLKCDVCGYHPIKRCYVLKSQERDQVVGMGLDCFKEHVIIPEKAKKEIHQYLNDINEFRDQILMSYWQGKRFPNDVYLRAVQHPNFDPTSDFGRRILEFKRADLPLYSRDQGSLKRLARNAKKAMLVKQQEQERLEKLKAMQRVVNTEQENGIGIYAYYRLMSLMPFLEQFFSSTDWEIEEIRVGDILKENRQHDCCFCGAVSDYLFILQSRRNDSSLVINPLHVAEHSIVKEKEARPLIKQINQITFDWKEIIKRYKEGSVFPKEAYNHALAEGFFDPEDKVDLLDWCGVLSDANLPLTKQVEQEMLEFNKFHDKSLEGDFLITSGAFQMILGMVQKEISGRTLIEDVQRLIEKYAAQKAKIELPAVDNKQIGSLDLNEKNKQLFFRKVELCLFASAFKDKLQQKNENFINTILNSYVENAIRVRLVDDISRLREYISSQ